MGQTRSALYLAQPRWNVTGFDPEVRKLFDRDQIIQYENADAIGDFAKTQTRVVRLGAQKPRAVCQRAVRIACYERARQGAVY